MQRFLVTILALAYLATSSGAEMRLHFCMGQLSGWSVWTTDQDKSCSKCGMEKEKSSSGCCRDEEKWIKIDDDQKINVLSFQLSPLQLEATGHFSHIELSAALQPTTRLSNGHAPPGNDLPVFKRCSVYRI